MQHSSFKQIKIFSVVIDLVLNKHSKPIFFLEILELEISRKIRECVYVNVANYDLDSLKFKICKVEIISTIN